MADLVLDWSALGAYGTNLENTAPDGVTTTVETGGVAVGITYTAQSQGAQAFTATTISPLPGSGLSISPMRSVSGPPVS